MDAGPTRWMQEKGAYWMSIGRRLFPLALALVLATVWSCQDVDDDDGNGPTGVSGGTETADPGVGAERSTLLANGEDQILVTALVTDLGGRPLVSVPVRFSANRGTLDAAYEVSDQDGRAFVLFTSERSGVDLAAQICAAIPDAVDSSSVVYKRGGEEIAHGDLVLPGAGAMIGLAFGKGDAGEVILSPADNSACVDVQMLGLSVSVDAALERVPADGLRSTTATARVRETTSGIPVAGQSVQFSTTTGTLEGDTETDANGVAVATLRSSTTPGTETLVAFSAGQADTALVEFTPLLFSVSTSTTVLPADGAESADVVATVLSEDRNPLPGLVVQFSTTVGAITSPVITDLSGRAVAHLTGEGVGGSTTVIGRFGSAASDTVAVLLSETFRPAAIVVRALPSVLVADGLANAAIIATVLDSVGGPVPDGTPVEFEIVSGTGTIFSRGLTEDGVARALLASGTAVGTTVVSATAGDVSGTAEVEYVAGDPATIVVTASPASLVGNGVETATITATVRDQSGNLIGGRDVSFESTRGSVDAG